MGLASSKAAWDLPCRGRTVGLRWKVLEPVRGWDLLPSPVIAPQAEAGGPGWVQGPTGDPGPPVVWLSVVGMESCGWRDKQVSDPGAGEIGRDLDAAPKFSSVNFQPLELPGRQWQVFLWGQADLAAGAASEPRKERARSRDPRAAECPLGPPGPHPPKWAGVSFALEEAPQILGVLQSAPLGLEGGHEGADPDPDLQGPWEGRPRARAGAGGRPQVELAQGMTAEGAVGSGRQVGGLCFSEPLSVLTAADATTATDGERGRGKPVPSWPAPSGPGLLPRSPARPLPEPPSGGHIQPDASRWVRRQEDPAEPVTSAEAAHSAPALESLHFA